MIRTKRETPLGFGYRIAVRHPPRRELMVVVRGRFVLAPGVAPGVFVRRDAKVPAGGSEEAQAALKARYEEATLALGQLPLQGDVYADDDTHHEGALLYPSDFAEFKPRTDFIAMGSCHPPGGSATVCKVAIELGDELRKELAVFGERRWIDRFLGGKHTEPEPFERMPLDWTRSFGGPGFPDNPVGRGVEGDALPNVEDPKHLLVDAGQRPAPASFGPVSALWPLRQKKVGKRYDDAWKRTREGHRAEDYDWSHQNAAPADQQLDGYLRGDERLAFENMHPAARRLETRLPGIRPRAFVTIRRAEAKPTDDASRESSEAPERLEGVEVPLSLDTVVADLDEGVLTVCWRGLTEVAEDDLSDVPFMLLAHEPLDAPPAPADGYLARLMAFAADPMGFSGSVLEKMQKLANEIDSGAIDDRIDGVDDTRSDAVSEIVGPMLGSDPEADTARRELAASIDEMERRDPGTKARLKVELKKALRQVAEGGGGAMPAMRSDGSLGVGAFVRQILRSVETAQQGAGDDFSGTNALVEAELARQDVPGLEPADRVIPTGDPPEPGPGVDLSGCDLSDRDLRGVDLTGAKLDGANLTRADLREAILVDATLEGASLGGADLSGADCRGARLRFAGMAKARAIATDFRGADLTHAQLDRADLSDAQLDEAKAFGVYAHRTTLEGASLRQASLGKAFFDQVQAEGADFGGARLDYAVMRDSALAYAKFDGASLTHTAFLTSRLDHASFLRAQGTRTSFQQSRLREIDARHARFDQPQLAEVDAQGASFSAASLVRGRFYKASLHGADLSAADLRNLDLRKASLTDADFRKSNLYQAMLHEAHGTDADFRGANLHGADMRHNQLVMKT